MNVFDDMGVYWAEIADKDQTERQIQFLKSLLKPDGYILDLACGTGRHSISLTRDGYGMVGFDISRRLLMIAKQRSRKVQIVRGDLRFLPFKSEAFTAGMSMDTSLGYLSSEKEDTQNLEETKRVLKKGGLLIVDVFNREQLRSRYANSNQASKWLEYPSFQLLQKRTVTPNGRWLCDHWIVRDKVTSQLKTFEHTVRLYGSGELQSLLNHAGFIVTHVFGDYEMQPFSTDTNQLILTAYVKFC